MKITNMKQAIMLMENHQQINQVHINGYQYEMQRFIDKHGLVGRNYQIEVLLTKPDYKTNEQYIRGYIVKRISK
jgi:cytochrome b involved in lipid metabolism